MHQAAVRSLYVQLVYRLSLPGVYRPTLGVWPSVQRTIPIESASVRQPAVYMAGQWVRVRWSPIYG